MNNSGSSRAPPPGPLNIRATSGSSSPTSPSASSEKMSRSMSSEFSSPPYFTSHNRKDSCGSNKSSQSARKVSSPINVYTTCGRHSNEWLFSGWFMPFNKKKSDN